MYVPPRLPVSLAGRSFARPESDNEGLPRGRTRARDVRAPSRAIRVPAVSGEALASRLGPYLLLTEGAVVSHSTAARLYGVPLPRRLVDDVVHLTRPAGAVAPRRKDVRGYQRTLGDDDVVRVDGLPVTSPARTWLDLAMLLSLDDLVWPATTSSVNTEGVSAFRGKLGCARTA